MLIELIVLILAILIGYNLFHKSKVQNYDGKVNCIF